MKRTANLLPLLLFSLATRTLAYKWPSPPQDALESLLYEGRRGDGSSLSTIVHPCRKRVGTHATVAAEWLRTGFHDMATHDAAAGTGGLDGSLAFELHREENHSIGFNQTFVDYQPFVNKYVSRSDLVALGTVFATATCGGPVIPFQGGRIDASVAGPAGVPEPQDDISSILDRFNGAGFSKSDMIILIACGHTIGGVRSTDFPDLVPAGSDPNVPNFENFDTTESFDNAVVTEYLDGTTKNPLVVFPNATMTSDMKVFSSDGNATMHTIASPDNFANSCRDILFRMINTVPSNVTLTEDIELLPAKVSNVMVTIERDTLVFKTSLRLMQSLNDTTTPRSRKVTLYWCDRNGDAAHCDGTKRFAQPVSNVTETDLSPVTKALGYSFTTYSFIAPIDPQLSISKFWFTSQNGDGNVTVYDNGGTGYVIEQDSLIFVPSSSDAVLENRMQRRGGFTAGGNYTKVYSFVVATRDASPQPSRIYMNALDAATQDFVPYRATVDFTRNDSSPSVQGYSFYTAQIEDLGAYLTFDVVAEGSGGESMYTLDFLQTTFLDNTPFVAPSKVQVTSASKDAPMGNAGMRVRAGLGLGGSIGASLAVGLVGAVLGLFL